MKRYIYYIDEDKFDTQEVKAETLGSALSQISTQGVSGRKIIVELVPTVLHVYEITLILDGIEIWHSENLLRDSAKHKLKSIIGYFDIDKYMDEGTYHALPVGGTGLMCQVTHKEVEVEGDGWWSVLQGLSDKIA